MTKIVLFGDSHGRANFHMIRWPKADIAACVGDFSTFGNELDTIAFIEEYKELPYKYKILVAGNHDKLFERAIGFCEDLCKEANIIHLFDRWVDINKIRIYGTPWQPPFNNWAFNVKEKDLVRCYAKIPKKTDILLTHCPPYGILDQAGNGYHCGSKALLERVKQVRPKVHAFGHLHESYGRQKIDGITYINCSLLDGNYNERNEPVLEVV